MALPVDSDLIRSAEHSSTHLLGNSHDKLTCAARIGLAPARIHSRLRLIPIVVASLVVGVASLLSGCASVVTAQFIVLDALTCSSSSILTPGNASCQVELNGTAPDGGAAIQMSSSNPAVSMPTKVMVPAGGTRAAFTVNVSSGLQADLVTLTASFNQISKAVQLQVKNTAPVVALNSVSCSSSVLASPGSALCSVNMTAAAPNGGSGVHLASSSSGISVPTWVVVSAGKTSASFSVNVSPGLPAEVITLTATFNQVSKAVQFQVNGSAPAVVLNSVSCSSSSLASPGTGFCTVKMTAAAPSGGSGIQLTSSTSGVTVPTWVVVPAGQTSAPFTVSVSPGLPAEVITLTATFNKVAKAVQLHVQSISTITLTVAPSSVTIKTGSRQQFTASVSGSLNTAVSWTISGSGCSKNTCGTITSTGLYTAPAALPSLSDVKITATSQQDSTKSASSNVVIVAASFPPSPGATYYMAPASGGGRDSNDGRSANAPWLTPNHPVNCGDVLLAAAGTYSPSSFYNGQWGPVNCPTGHNVAWVKCSTPFACNIPDTIFISASYWGMQGFRLSSSSGSCLTIAPNFNGKRVEVHHVVVANNIVGPCEFDGVSSVSGYNSNPTIGADYLAYLGNIAYNTGGESSTCAAALSFWVPIPYDTQPGTHLYMAGNFAWGNTSNCGDGEGIIFDTFDGVEGSSKHPPYAYQAVAENNLTVFNDGPGIQVDLNQNGPGAHAPVYFLHNTSAYNCLGPSNADYCAEIVLGTTVDADASFNLVVAPSQYAFGGSRVHHYGSAVMYAPGSTNHISNEFAYSAYGYGVGSVGSAGFVASPGNITSTDPLLAGPAAPGTPSCSGYATTTACMATVIANFAPTNAVAAGYGYQQPSNTPVSNPFYPQWLCGVTDLPAGIVTVGCAR